MKPIILEIREAFPRNISEDIDRLLANLPYSPIWQSVAWQRMIRETGYSARSFFVGIYSDDRLLGYALVEKRSIGLGQFGFFVIGGPVIVDESCVFPLSEALIALSEREKVVFVQYEALIEVEFPGFSKDCYKKFIESNTAIINLTETEEEILARMKQKGRYNIRVAEKSGVTVESVPFSEENLNTFYTLLSETNARDSFAINSKDYFWSFLQYLERENLGGLRFAKWESETIAAGIFVFSGATAFYYYGASTSDNEKRKYMATYLLQWEAIREAKARGCAIYDFLGIAPSDEPNHHLSGVTDFKLKLSPVVREWPAARIHVVKPVVYLGMRVVRWVKEKIGRFR